MFYLGLDIGGTTTKIGIFDEDLNIIVKDEIVSNDSVDLIEYICYYIKEKYHEYTFKGIGIGVPGFVLKNGIVLKSANLNLLNYDIKSKFMHYFNTEVVVGNDANVAALAELQDDNLEMDQTNVMITLGTGVGGGVVKNQIISWGSHGMANEIGHINVDSKYNFECGCGKKGCLETLSSATGIVRLYKYYKKDYPGSSLNKLDKVEAKDIFDAAKANDQLGQLVVDEAIFYLAKACETIAMIYDINKFVIGGGVSKAGIFLIDKLKKAFYKQALVEFNDVQFIQAQHGNEAGIIGAALLVKNI